MARLVTMDAFVSYCSLAVPPLPSDRPRGCSCFVVEGMLGNPSRSQEGGGSRSRSEREIEIEIEIDEVSRGIIIIITGTQSVSLSVSVSPFLLFPSLPSSVGFNQNGL